MVWIGSSLTVSAGSRVWIRDAAADRTGVVPVLSVPAGAWAEFVAAVRTGLITEEER